MTTTLTADESIELLRVGIGALALWIMYFHVWSDYKLDAFRQRLFDLRADLFEFAATSGLPFDHPAYGKLRDRINRIIRWADQFTAMHFFLIVLAVSDDEPMPRPHREWTADLQTVDDPEIRKQLMLFENRMASIVVRRVFLTPVGIPFLLVLTICVITKRLFSETAEQLRKRFAELLVAGGPELAFEHLSASVPGIERMEAQTAIEDAFALRALAA